VFDVLIPGEINPDLILSGDVVPRFGQVEQLLDTASLTIGSSSAIFACGSARLGLKPAMIGVCGDDLFGRFMLNELRERQVDVQNVIVRRGESTGLSVILSQGVDRSILTFPGAIGALRASDIGDGLLRLCRHLHVASYYLQTQLRPDLPALFEHARRLGLSTSLDTNFDPAEEWHSLDSVLPWVDILLLNEREAIALSGAADLQGAIDRLAPLVGTVAIKLGPDGAVATREGRQTRASSMDVSAVDTVGAGDSFDAGFVYGVLNNWGLDRSLRLACACGSLSTLKAGGTDGQPTLAEALKYVS
jgi:sugar/nucleoside kinase (ribokinase family)